MIVIICGSRGFIDYEFINRHLDHFFKNQKPDEIIHGDCKDSADMCAKRYAEENGIKCTPYPAEWKKYGKAAGPIRNTTMAVVGTHCIGFNAGTDGTTDMLKKATANFGKKKVKEVKIILSVGV